MEKTKTLRSVFVIEKIEFLSTLIDLSLVRHSVHTFTHSDHDCLHYIRDFVPDLLLVDYQTLKDHMDEFFESLTQEDNLKEMAIIGLGFPEEKDLFGKWSTLFCDYLEKPLEVHTLYGLLSKALEKAESRP